MEKERCRSYRTHPAHAFFLLFLLSIAVLRPVNGHAAEQVTEPAQSGTEAADETAAPAPGKTEKTNKKAERLIRTAEAEIGYSTNAKKEKTKYEKEIFGSNGHLWCASFVSWCSVKAGISSKRVPRSMSTLYMAERAKKNYSPWNKNTWKKLRRGDVFFISPRKAKLRFANGGKAVHHVGIVQRVDRENKLLYTVEGNVSRITKKGEVDLSKRVVRACVYQMKPKSGKILKSETGFSDGEYICGTIRIK